MRRGRRATGSRSWNQVHIRVVGRVEWKHDPHVTVGLGVQDDEIRVAAETHPHAAMVAEARTSAAIKVSRTGTDAIVDRCVCASRR